MNYPQILIVEDDLQLQQALQDTLELAGYQLWLASNAQDALVIVQQQAIDLVITDVNMAGMDGYQLLTWLRQHRPAILVIMMTAYGSVDRAVQAMQLGAADYLLKPFDPELLLSSIAKVAGQPVQQADAPVAVSPASLNLLDMARRVAQTDTTVLIAGESGTGKEVLARYIHQQSVRKDNCFIAINCAAIPENMLEATLFGHEKGAFTGAIASQPGKFEQANGGTLLLDEISEMPLALQAKLLRVLQERELERVGGRKVIKLDLRILATTNRDLRQEVAKGNFREDLFYRLNVVELAWQPLRQRLDDILPIANALLRHHAKRMGRPAMQFSQSAQQSLLGYHWPGNIRELDNSVQRALIFAQGLQIQAIDLGLPIATDPSPQPVFMAQQSEAQATPVALAQSQSMSQTQPKVAASSGMPENGTQGREPELQLGVKEHELAIIKQAIRASGGKKKEAAEQLGISPRTLRYKLARMRELGWDVDAMLA